MFFAVTEGKQFNARAVIATDAEVDLQECGRFLCRGDPSAATLEWTGRPWIPAATPQDPCLPARGSVQLPLP